MGRMGSRHGNGSGDIFVAFSTANRGRRRRQQPGASAMPATITRLAGRARWTRCSLATVEATEEAIINAMVAAETMTGADYWRFFGLPHDQLRSILRKHGQLVEGR